jgi:hypothetical protein
VLALFRNNQVTTALLLGLFTLLLRLPGILGLIPFDTDSEGDAGFTYSLLLGWAIDKPTVSAILSTLLVFLQAILMNWLVNQSRVNPDRNWLVPMFYVLLASCVSDFQFLSPPLVAATFLPLVYRLIFNIYKGNNTTLLVFDIGLLVATAALIYLPVFWLLPVALLSILHLRSLKVHEVAAFAAGAITPGFLGWALSFLNDQGWEFRHAHFSGLFEFWDLDLSISISTWVKVGFMAFLLLLVFFNYGTYYHKRLIQVQKYNNLLYWLIISVCLTAFLRNIPHAEHFILAATGVGTFLALSFQSLKNKGVAEVLFIALLGAIYTTMFIFG